AKRGRPPTRDGQSKKEAANLTGQSLRNVQRATTTKAKGASSPGPDERPIDMPGAKPSVNAKDDALFGFSATVQELFRRTRDKKPERFAATSVSPDHLEALAGFLTELAKLKVAGAVQEMHGSHAGGNDTTPAGAIGGTNETVTRR